MQMHHSWARRLGAFIAIGVTVVGLAVLTPARTRAVTLTDSHDVTVTATVYGPPPATPAIVTSPTNNTQVYVTPQVIRGTCGDGLTVKIYSNGDLIGTTDCATDGTFSVNVTLKFGRNELTALNFDFQDQQGPGSDTVVVTVANQSIANTAQPAKRRIVGKPAPSNSTEQSSPTIPSTPAPNNNGFLPGIVRPITSYVHATWLLAILIIVLLLLGDLLFNKRRLFRKLYRQRTPRPGPFDNLNS